MKKEGREMRKGELEMVPGESVEKDDGLDRSDEEHEEEDGPDIRQGGWR